jgi:glycosyltransferase involved in cell wall biosynthesis
MATYNGERYIKEQLESILCQLGESDEVVISDDVSSDRTIEIIKSIEDPRIKVYFNNSRNYSKNFENAISQASGDIIFISDQDDVWMSNKVKLFLEKLRIFDLVVSDVSITDEKLIVEKRSHFQEYNVKKGFWINFIKTRYIGASMAFHRKILKKVLPLPTKSKFCAYDYWIAIVCELYYNVGLINIPTMYYRRHNSNASGGGLKSEFSLKRKIFTRIYSLFYLLKRMFKI